MASPSSSFTPFVGLTWPLHACRPRRIRCGRHPTPPMVPIWRRRRMVPRHAPPRVEHGSEPDGVYRCDSKSALAAQTLSRARRSPYDRQRGTHLHLSIGWRVAGSAAAFTPIAFPCPSSGRRRTTGDRVPGAVGGERTSPSLCDRRTLAMRERGFTLTSGSPTDHWHTSQLDNASRSTPPTRSRQPRGRHVRLQPPRSSRTFNHPAATAGTCWITSYDPVYLK